MQTEWQPIETAPKDGTRFIAKIGNAIYAAYYRDDSFRWIMHLNQASGRSYKKVVIDGIEYQQELMPEGERNYQPQALIWLGGFEDKPTHWLPLPELPTTR